MQNSSLANANSATAAGTSAKLGAQAGNIYGSLAPQLQAEATHPTGYGATDLAAMNTAGQQSAGGSNAGAAGQGALLAARTKNAGTADAAIAQSTRNSSQNLSNDALKTQMGNANLKQQQQQAGIQGEQNLYGTNLGASNTALGLSNSALGVSNDALKNASTAKGGFLSQLGDTAMDAGEAYATGGASLLAKKNFG